MAVYGVRSNVESIANMEYGVGYVRLTGLCDRKLQWSYGHGDMNWLFIGNIENLM